MPDYRVRDLKRGMVVWECGGCGNVKLLVTSDAAEEDGGWSATTMTLGGLMAEGSVIPEGHYDRLFERDPHKGPQLYRVPAYWFQSSGERARTEPEGVDEAA